jgi:hypothetical protein
MDVEKMRVYSDHKNLHRRVVAFCTVFIARRLPAFQKNGCLTILPSNVGKCL